MKNSRSTSTYSDPYCEGSGSARFSENGRSLANLLFVLLGMIGILWAVYSFSKPGFDLGTGTAATSSPVQPNPLGSLQVVEASQARESKPKDIAQNPLGKDCCLALPVNDTSGTDGNVMTYEHD